MLMRMALTAQALSKGDGRRSRLLDLGLELFGTRSYADISIDDIAAAAEISRGLLYHYFSNKRTFYTESVRYAADQLLERVRLDLDKPPAENLREGLNNYLGYVENFGTAYAMLLRGGLGYDAAVVEILETARQKIVDDILEGLGLMDPPAVFRVAVRSWIGMVETACMDWLENRSTSREDLVELFIASLTAVIEAAQARADLAPVTPR